MNVSIVIPTYNERENITELIPRIFDFFAGNDLNGNLIVVDDGSPDNTAEEVKRLENKYPIYLIERGGKQGLGSAYIAGFRKAMGLGSDIIFEMDADFSHDPRYLPEFIENLGCSDLVLGSRYVEGGGIGGWGLWREAVSKGANFLARILLGLDIRDITTGYRAYKNEVLQGIDLDSIRSDGYGFQAEILFKVKEKGFKVKEIPIKFVDRRKGKSKLSKTEIIRFFILCMKLGFKRKT